MVTASSNLNNVSADATPRLTINHDATVDLDSTNAFEGPEKLLEVWFAPSPGDLPVSAAPGGLKAVAVDEWKTMLDLVKCQVLSVLASEHVDAYLLSESSMFVFPHKLILKTCGTTTLLSGLPKMLQIAAQSAGLGGECVPAVNGCSAPAAPVAAPYRVFYSRKNFLYPDKQRGPHRSWADEVRFLDTMFLGGSAYLVGKMNGEHWYLYITSPDTRLTPPPSPEWESSSAPPPQSPVHADDEDVAGAVVAVEDETLEVLMTDLDPECAKRFYLHNAMALLADPALRASAPGVISGGPTPANGATNGATNGAANGTTNGAANGATTIGTTNGTATNAGDICHSAPPSPSVAADPLSTEGHVLGSLVSKVTGLSEIYPQSQYPDARIDAYLFSPCGYSANGVIPAAATAAAPAAAPSTTHYFTVHVTPEPHCSYASFETNVPSGQSGRATAEVVAHVVNIFRPGRFSVTLFEAKPPLSSSPPLAPLSPSPSQSQSAPNIPSGRAAAAAAAATTGKKTRMEAVAGYRRVERIVHDLDGYDLVFRYYEREGWKGGAPRLGEKAAMLE